MATFEVIRVANIGGGGGTPGGTDGQVQYNNAGAFGGISEGTSGQVLTSTGAGSAPTFQDAAGGSSLFPVTGTGTATGDVTGDLNGHTLHVSNGGNDFLTLTPSGNQSLLQTTDGSNYAYVNLNSDGISPNVDAQIQVNDPTGQSDLLLRSDASNGYTFDLKTYDGTNTVEVKGDAIANTLVYTAATHTFTGNVGIGATPSADKVFLINTGIYDAVTIDKTNFDSRFGMGDDTGVSYIKFYTVASGSIYGFQLYSDNGDNHVEMDGDAGANTIKITAGAGVSLSAPASSTAAILANGTISFYLDESGNNLKVAVQYSDGTTKTGTVALA